MPFDIHQAPEACGGTTEKLKIVRGSYTGLDIYAKK
jgi:hypothetical protein